MESRKISILQIFNFVVLPKCAGISIENFTIRWTLVRLISSVFRLHVFMCVSSISVDYGPASPVHGMNQAVDKVHRNARPHLQKICMRFHSSCRTWIDVIEFSLNLVPWMPMGLKSGLRASQVLILMLFCCRKSIVALVVYTRALSCWKVLFWWCAKCGTTCGRRTSSVYRAAFTPFSLHGPSFWKTTGPYMVQADSAPYHNGWTSLLISFHHAVFRKSFVLSSPDPCVAICIWNGLVHSFRLTSSLSSTEKPVLLISGDPVRWRSCVLLVAL